MVCLAWASKGGGVGTVTKHFIGDREEVRRQSVICALQGVLERTGGT
jgi:nicotinamide mononucleotide (NMN) deamidase PncC